MAKENDMKTGQEIMNTPVAQPAVATASGELSSEPNHTRDQLEAFFIGRFVAEGKPQADAAKLAKVRAKEMIP